MAILSAVAFLAATKVEGQTLRYWYDATCQCRWDAVLARVGDSSVDLLCSDGTSQEVSLQLLHEADRGFVKACRVSAVAALLLAETPYVTGAQELRDLRDRLIANHVSERLANYVALQPNVTNIPVLGDRQLSDIRKRWVEIQGMHYEVLRADVSSSVTGFKELVVRRPDGNEEVLTADWVKEVRILPACWEGITYRVQGRDTYGKSLGQFRGPGSALVVLPELSWKDRLVFDPIHSVWTDQQSREAHALLRDAEILWEKAREYRRLRREPEKLWEELQRLGVRSQDKLEFLAEK